MNFVFLPELARLARRGFSLAGELEKSRAKDAGVLRRESKTREEAGLESSDWMRP
jgi:hypothetical protein